MDSHGSGQRIMGIRRILKSIGFKRSQAFGSYYYDYPPKVELIFLGKNGSIPGLHASIVVYYHGVENKDLANELASKLARLSNTYVGCKVLLAPLNKPGTRIPGSHKRTYSLETSMILYRGALYKEADVPPNMEPTNPADPKALVSDEPNFGREEVTEVERPTEPIPYTPKVELAISKLEKKLEIAQKWKIPYKLLKQLISQYNLPSAQLLISDFATSKKRLVKRMEEVLEDLRRVAQ